MKTIYSINMKAFDFLLREKYNICKTGKKRSAAWKNRTKSCVMRRRQQTAAAIVSNGSKLYERYRTRITDWNAEVRFGVELKR